MTANTIVKPVSRRRFFMFLGAAAASPIIHHIIPKKLIFDMSGPVTTATVPWRHYFKSISIPIEDITDSSILDQMNQITMRFIVPTLADEVFKPSPMFWSLNPGMPRWSGWSRDC